MVEDDFWFVYDLCITRDRVFVERRFFKNKVYRSIDLADIVEVKAEKQKRWLFSPQVLTLHYNGVKERFTIAVGQNVNVFDVKTTIDHLRKQKTLGVVPVRSPSRDPLPVVGEVSGLTEFEDLLVGVIKAYRESQMISYEQFYDLCKQEFDIEKEDIKVSLIRLINDNVISGFLTSDGYRRDAVLHFHCQVCDSKVINPLQYWQCPDCNRYICEACKSQFVYCPNHEETQTPLVKMPLICTHCRNAIKNLEEIEGYTCPFCLEPIPPL